MFDLFIVVFKGKCPAWFAMVSVTQKSFHSTLCYLAVKRHKMSCSKKTSIERREKDTYLALDPDHCLYLRHDPPFPVMYQDSSMNYPLSITNKFWFREVGKSSGFKLTTVPYEY